MKRNKLGQFTSEGIRGEENPRWAGGNLTYSGVHQWMSNTFGRPKNCDDCGSVRIVQWANISGEYLKKREDWKPLCYSCHRIFDGIAKLSKTEVEEIKNRIRFGETQRAIAEVYGVTQTTIKNINRGLTKCYA